MILLLHSDGPAASCQIWVQFSSGPAQDTSPSSPDCTKVVEHYDHAKVDM